MIPKVIHYCWFGGNELPIAVKKCIESWKKYCPDYEIRCWNENDFDYTLFDYTKVAYENGKWAFVSDVARLWIVFHNGGIYLDTDVELINNIDELLNYDSFWSFENEKHIATGLGFGAIRKNKFVKALLDDYENLQILDKDGYIQSIPCTDINTKVFERMGVKINNETQIIDNNIFLDTRYMCPLNYLTGKITLTDKCVSIHHYDASWYSNSKKIRKKISTSLNRWGLWYLSTKFEHICDVFFDIGIKNYLKRKIKRFK